MLRICSRALVKVGMMKPCHLVKPASVRNLSQLKELPKQPVPPLQQSCELYLSNLEPILEEDELKRAKELVEEFQKAGGVGERLQRCLERKARNTDNWMADDYVRIYYMLRRRSLVGFSNPGGTFPRMDFRDKKGQIRCAAKLITAAVEFKTKIDNDTLPVEYMRGKPMCMKQYKQLMSSCRIPGLKEDSLEFYTDKHIVVVRNCQFFALDVYNSDGSLLTEDQLCVQLERICDLSAQTDAEPVGILTTEHRDLWSKTYMNLNRDETNRQSTSAIERSIFLLCLDGSLAPVPEEMYQTSALNYMVHGGGSQLSSGNRWFDKGVQLIVAEDGTVGMNLSNASADGIIMMSLSQYLIEDLKKPRLTQSRMEPLPVPQKLHFNLTPEIKKDIEDAKQHLDKLVEDLDMSFTVFEHYGKNLIRSHKMSPDAFVQMALLLAYYRKYQKNDALMEPVSLRTFREGRLSLMIVNTPASAAFVKAFDDPQKQNSEKLDLLEKALETHAKNTDMALRGHDVFGHFWGLRLQAVKENIPVPELFTDNTFHEVFKYKLAGSHIVNKAGTIPAFGPEEPGQYDVVYGILNDHIHFVVASVKSARCKENNAAEMARAMDDALLDMRTLLEQTRGAEL